MTSRRPNVNQTASKAFEGVAAAVIADTQKKIDSERRCQAVVGIAAVGALNEANSRPTIIKASSPNSCKLLAALLTL